ncbi:unnamed protein product [Arabidopsis lyrata]|nr:unnamed protein product [Arabidopsis lyrata]
MSTSLRTTTAASRLSRLLRSSSSSISTLALSASFLSISPDLSSLLHFFIIHLSLTYASPSLLNLYRRAVTFLLRDLRSKLGFPSLRSYSMIISSLSFRLFILRSPPTSSSVSAVATSEDCSTFYYNDCVSKYIAAKLQDNILSIECLVSGCKSSGRLEPDKCRQILPREVFDQWDDALSEAVLMRSKRLYCPYKDCSTLLFIDKSEVKMKDSECPHCHRMVCVECGTKWHPEITCEEFQKLAGNERGRDNISLATMAKKKNWKRCYSCKLYIEKSQGCLYMKCRWMLCCRCWVVLLSLLLVRICFEKKVRYGVRQEMALSVALSKIEDKWKEELDQELERKRTS